jgi:nickel-dependent lactate racemase
VSEFKIPYGREHLTFSLANELRAEWIAPAQAAPAPDPIQAVDAALDAPFADPRQGMGNVRLADFAGAKSVAIAVNDKTRPVPHKVLLPPLLARLKAMGLPREAITLIVAVGAHAPMPPGEFAGVIPLDILERHTVISHDPDDPENLVYLGATQRGTPVWINRRFAQADLRIVVGNIEPHQFQGFSGGYKTAAIGLAGKDTVNHNHAMMTDLSAVPLRFDDNPPRQDIEEMGRMIGVHFALNAVVNESKQIVQVLAGEPGEVMRRGIPLARQIYQVEVRSPEARSPFDLIIASPGGHPKDINLYQAQKALAHASLVMKDGGTVILVAACLEGTGSTSYERWMEGVTSFEAVFEKFKREGFRVGPHKAYQIARDACRVRVLMVTEMQPDLVRRLLLDPVPSLDEALSMALRDLPSGARVGVMPAANSTIPVI